MNFCTSFKWMDDSLKWYYIWNEISFQITSGRESEILNIYLWQTISCCQDNPLKYKCHILHTRIRLFINVTTGIASGRSRRDTTLEELVCEFVWMYICLSQTVLTCEISSFFFSSENSLKIILLYYIFEIKCTQYFARLWFGELPSKIDY